MTTDETTKDPGAAPDPAPAEAPRPQTEPDRPHGDPLTGDEDHGTRHGVTPPADDEPAAGEAAGAPDAVSAAEAKAAEYLDLAQRKQAEFENFRRRMNAQVGAAEDRGVGRLAKELLPALDHLELALKAAAAEDEVTKGFAMVRDELLAGLGKAGIQAFSPQGEPFDPNQHEAMAQQPSEDAESGTVLQVYQQGYRINGAVLRPARVVVAA